MKDIINNAVHKFLNENMFSGKTIINVDIQPEYENFISFNLYEWVSFINKNSENNDIVFLYNGADTLGMVEENDYKYWLVELGMDEDVVYNSTFYDKGYAFFRFCMDNSIDDDSIVDLVKFMINNNITDTRDVDEQMWNEFVEQSDYDYSEIRELLEHSEDMINIPDLMDFISYYSNIILMGGGIDECLKEVEIALKSLGKDYKTYSKYVY